MGSKGAAAAVPAEVYEDFVPSSKLVKEEHCDILHLDLPGFKKEQLRVQLSIAGILKISGQRPIGQNKWKRFQKEFPITENCDRSKISAKFENGILYVRQPKLTTPAAVKKDRESPATEAENAPAVKRQKTTLRDEFTKQNASDANASAKESSKEEEAKNTSTTKATEQTEAKSVEEKPAAEKRGTSSSSSSESENESTDDENMGNASCLVTTNLKRPRKVIKMTLAALFVLGIGLYVANVMIKSTNEAEE